MRELSLGVMDIVQNSISAGADNITVTVDESLPNDLLSVIVEDNGCGMTPKQAESIANPFYTTRTTRKVGLGVPLFKMRAEMTGGSFYITSQKGVGTCVTANFKPSSVDMIPQGDINGTVRLLIACNPTLDFKFVRKFETTAGKKRQFTLDTKEMRETLGTVPLNSPEVTLWVKEYLAEQTDELLK